MVDAVGPSGIAKVELWGTRDGGRTWNSFGTDPDRQSPMIVTLHEEGTYGFCVSVQNGVGLGGDPPKPGQTPDIWVTLDVTKPEVRLICAEQGTGERAGKLVIRWEARDWLLASHPISLYYSETLGGPWVPIVASLENVGQYDWTVQGRVPDRIHLRIEARDAAGNLGIYETPQPVVLDRLRPTAHIHGLRPVSPAPSAATPR